MAALPENDRIAGPFIAVAGQTDVPADFPLILEEGLRLLIERAGHPSVIVAPPAVTAITPGPSGFTARVVQPFQAGDKVWVYSQLPAARTRQHTPNGAIRSTTLEDDATYAQAQLQEHLRDLSRAVLAPVGSPPPSPQDVIDAAKAVEGRATTDLANVDQDIFAGKSFAVLPGGQSMSLYDRLGRKFDLLDLGAVDDNETDIVPFLQAGLTRLKAAGGGLLRLPRGPFAWLSDLPTLSVANEENIKIVGEGMDHAYIRVGGAATRGFRLRSTTTDPNRLPRFEFEGFTLAASGEKLGWGIDCEWAINGDIEDPLSIHNVAVQQHLKSLADDGTDFGYFQKLIRVCNARNSNIQDFRLFGDLDRIDADKTTDAILLEGECTSFRVANGYVLEAQNGLRSSGATEGLYCLNVDLIAVETGVDMGAGSVLEPQFTWQGGTIAATRKAITLSNVRYFRVADTFILGKKGWNAFNPSHDWTGVEVKGALSGFGVIDAEFSKEDQQGADGHTSTAVDLQSGQGYDVRGSVHAYAGADPIDYGVRLRAGVTRSKADITAVNVSVDYDYAPADGNTVIRRVPGEFQIMGANDQFLTVIGQAAAWMKLLDLSGGANSREVRLLNDGGGLAVLLVNDDGSTKRLPFEISSAGVPTLGDGVWNSMPLKMGSHYLWFDGAGRLRTKVGGPSSDTDGVVVGGQS